MNRVWVFAAAVVGVPFAACVSDDSSTPDASGTDGGGMDAPLDTTMTQDSPADVMMEAEAEAGPPPTGAYVSSLVLPDVTFGPALAVAPNGDVIVGGYFTGPVTINSLTYTGFGSRDHMILRVAPNEGIQWVQQYGGSDDDRLVAAASDPSGNAYVAGWVTMTTLSTQIAYGTQKLSATHTGLTSMVVKLDPTGTAQWVTSFDGTTSGGQSCSSLATNPVSSAVAVACSSTAAFSITDTSNAVHAVTNSSGLVVVELDPTTGKASTTKTLYLQGAGGARLGYDAAGDLYVAGGMSANVTGYVPAWSTTSELGLTRKSTGNNSDGYVLKLKAADWSMSWSKDYTSTSSSVGPAAIALDSAGNAWIAGGFGGGVNFGIATLTAVGPGDAFVLELDPTGTALAANSYGASGCATSVYGVGVDTTGVTVGGSYQGVGGSASLTIGTTAALPSAVGGAWAAWEAKLSLDLKTAFWADGNTSTATTSSEGVWASSVVVDPTSKQSIVAGTLIYGSTDFGGGTVMRNNAAYIVRRAP